MAKLSGRTAIVTGGASGMGRGVALSFAEEGASVAVLDRNEAGAKEVAAAAAKSGVKTIGLACDVGNEASVKSAFAAAASALGDIDILVNNAGIDTTELIENMSTEMWDDMMRVNLDSIFFCSREVIPAMKRKGWGRIINFSSQLAHKGAPLMAHYCATKAGVMGFTRSLAYELVEHGITVNSINPGPIDTPLYMGIPEAWRRAKEDSMPIKRPGRVEEVVPTVLLLASDAGSFYVGASMNMNGGDVMV
ncbi:MAG: SDR family NAD(P)-dependent oxidoreductase [Proteobacteria bacterium]|nr:SDR family NAD(P)-dependent oxidoreductase [Pseudomonadota bacterium]